jgi:hypothetical protein
MKGSCYVDTERCVSLQVYAAVRLRTPFFWHVTPHRWVIGSRNFEEMYCLCLQGSTGPRRFLHLVLEDEGTRFFRNVANRLPSDAASHPKTKTFRVRVCIIHLNCRNLQLFSLFPRERQQRYTAQSSTCLCSCNWL